MENFVVSFRKYRPSSFNSVVGQTHIAGTLKNAIRNNHLAQAFLFCGPRGVGKTSSARILAKTINCSNLSADIEPCNECDSCKSFNGGASLNIFELDAASNNSVEDIRLLVDQVRYAPQTGKYKIYIIDEVHMLSQAAFNAFLKTLEEPPSYAIFILATTEKHKILPTILSRCQIFDFQRISVSDAFGQLQKIAGLEGVTFEDEALYLIAQKADGALRDALSIFDKMVSVCGNHITYQAVIENLNILDYDYYFRITEQLLGKQMSASLLLLDEILRKGFDGHLFITGLAEHFRNLMVCKDPATVVLLEVAETARDRYRSQAAQVPADLLLNWLQLANRCDAAYKTSRNPRLQVELTLMKMCHVGDAMALLAEGGAPKKQADRVNPVVPKVTVTAKATGTPAKVDTGPKVDLGNLQNLREQLLKRPENAPEAIAEEELVRFDAGVNLDIDQAKLDAALEAFRTSEFRPSAGAPRKLAFLKTCSLGYDGGNRIFLNYSGTHNRELLTEILEALKPALCKRFQEPRLYVEPQLQKEESSGEGPARNKFFNLKDKVEHFQQKSPHFDELVKALDLNPEA